MMKPNGSKVKELLDKDGNPLVKPEPLPQKIRALTSRTWARIISIGSILAIIAGIITNSGKIVEFAESKFFDSSKALETSVSLQLEDTIKATKIRSIVDQPTQIREFGDTGMISLFWEVTLSNNGKNDSSIIDWDALKVTVQGMVSYSDLKQGIYELQDGELKPISLPITIPSGYSSALFIKLGVKMDKDSYLLSKEEYSNAGTTEIVEILNFLRSEGIDIFGNTWAQLDFGGYKLSELDSIEDPTFLVSFKTARGNDVETLVSRYKHGLFSQLPKK